MTMPDPTITKVALTSGGAPVGIGFATIILTPKGQDPTYVDDNLIVLIDLELPAEQEGYDHPECVRLHPLLQFGDRVATVFDTKLTRDWSQTPKRVARQHVVNGTIWATIMTAAATYAANEVAKITTALAVRDAEMAGGG